MESADKQGSNTCSQHPFVLHGTELFEILELQIEELMLVEMLRFLYSVQNDMYKSIKLPTVSALHGDQLVVIMESLTPLLVTSKGTKAPCVFTEAKIKGQINDKMSQLCI